MLSCFLRLLRFKNGGNIKVMIILNRIVLLALLGLVFYIHRRWGIGRVIWKALVFLFLAGLVDMILTRM